MKIIQKDTPIGTRVYSKNYGYGTIVKRTDDGYNLIVIELDGLTTTGSDGTTYEHFRKGHQVHVDECGRRSFWSDPNIEVDFFIQEN